MPFRQERANSFLLQELTKLVQGKLRDPRVLSVSITEVDITNDMRLARVYVATYEGGEALEEGIEGLDSAKGFLRRELSQVLHWRFTPYLEFRPDRSWQYGVKIDNLLDEIHAHDEAVGHVPEEDDDEDASA